MTCSFPLGSVRFLFVDPTPENIEAKKQLTKAVGAESPLSAELCTVVDRGGSRVQYTFILCQGFFNVELD